MEFRWLVLCNKHGKKTVPVLQWRMDSMLNWKDVPMEEFKDWQVDEEGNQL